MSQSNYDSHTFPAHPESNTPCERCGAWRDEACDIACLAEDQPQNPQEQCSCGRTVTAFIGDQFGFTFACLCGRRWRKR